MSSRAALRQHLALCKHDDVVAAFGLVEIGCAEQHRQALVVDQLQDDLPQFAARQRIDADRRLVQQQHSGERTSVQASPASASCRPTVGRPAAGERPERGHLHQPRIVRSRSAALTPCRSA